MMDTSKAEPMAATTAMPAKFEALQNLSFEAAIQELSTVTKQLETGDQNLETLLSLYERGMLLNQYCQHLLDVAEQKVAKLQQTETGLVETELEDHKSAY